MSIIPKTIRANIFFQLDELYRQCCQYAILNLCTLDEAQLAVIGEVIFAE
ncbi:MAG: hypothetical protein IKD26_04975 [Clostridia bacterium]|nr:hypothetical protein [Clostridia bacterium]MBR7177545.1 hypothetical protein [Clostridia bacterium]